MDQIYADIAARTGGNIYVGVVGRCVPENRPHQTDHGGAGDSQHFRSLPQRARPDELPQSGSGKTIMTSEPKFVPEEAVEISPDGTSKLRVRMIDSVGYMVAGAVGATEERRAPHGDDALVRPRDSHDGGGGAGDPEGHLRPLHRGIVVTTDGSVTDIPRSDYLEAEERVIRNCRSWESPSSCCSTPPIPKESGPGPSPGTSPPAMRSTAWR